MSFIQSLETGDNVVTTINLPYVPQNLLIGDPNADVPIKKIEVSIAGRPFIQIPTNEDIITYSKLENSGFLGADVAVSQVIRIADGFIPNQTFQARLTNSGAFTPDIYANSFRKGSKPVFAASDQVIANNFQPISDFSHLIFDEDNLDYAQLKFADGHEDKFTVEELKQRSGMMNISDADGELGSRLVIDNSIQDIVLCTLFANANALDFIKVNL